ncbi:MAG: argininosuccinate lyase [Candidatus Peribacteraceae bacterium]|nr:argininosuccinate lyase [Candidatus Peribacteraceae bacterium]MDP7645577.1 argininosuccinate lyase [Candidatus Peribacteraceae bacterium]
MSKLWSKSSAKLHPKIEAYTAGDDVVLDMVLMPYDIRASKAHAKGLSTIGVLTSEELSSIINCLDELMILWTQKKVEIRVEDEDCHTVIENFLVSKLGDTGKKIHTGRSRNDQVLVAIRLYMKDQLAQIRNETIKLSREFLAKAKQYQDVPMSGYTHTQQAMLSSLGHYYMSFAESLVDDAEFITSVRGHIDKSPLGSAAGYGVAFPLERGQVAEELGFKSVQNNSLYCQNSRGKFESAYLEALVQVMMTLSKFATDMILFTSREFEFFLADNSIVTGSSIMPQKRNMDGLEILRGNLCRVIANQHLVQDLSKGLISGYHRDFQLMKKPIMESSDILVSSLEVAGLYLNGLTPVRENIEAKIKPDIFMADIANEMVAKEGIAFRDAYKKASESGQSNFNLQENLKSKQSLGSPGNLGIEKLEERLSKLLP